MSRHTTHLRFEPVAFPDRLALLVPRPRINLVMYYGILAPRGRWPGGVVASTGSEWSDAPGGSDPPDSGGSDRSGSRPTSLPVRVAHASVLARDSRYPLSSAIAMDAEEIWREKSDQELVEAGGRLSEFTSEGERIIRAELRRRGLPDPPTPADYCWKCGRGIYADGPDDACGNCGEPLAQAVRARLAETDEQLTTEVVYRSRFAHEVELVNAQLEESGIVAAPGASGFGADVRLRYLGIPALNVSEYTVVVAGADASRAREIIEGLPVSHDDDEETPPALPSDEP